MQINYAASSNRLCLCVVRLVNDKVVKQTEKKLSCEMIHLASLAV